MTTFVRAFSSPFRKHIALPQQHGSWVLWLVPLVAGIGVGGVRPALVWLLMASLGAFLALQPATILVKAASGRRTKDDLAPALFWLAAYGGLMGIGPAGLALTGNGWLLALATLALPTLAWQLWLVSRKAERHHLLVEMAGTAVLALAAPAVVWLDRGGPSAQGGVLWLLCALQGAASIAHVYVRLVYRRMTVAPSTAERWRLARGSLVFHALNGALVAALAMAGVVPLLTVAAFVAMLAEAVYGGMAQPCIGAKPSAIGMRQTAMALVFAVFLVAAYAAHMS